MNFASVTVFATGLSLADVIRWALCGGIVVLWLALLSLMLTRWGQVRPLAKCAVLSLFAHLLLGGYAYITQLLVEVPGLGAPVGDEQFASLRLLDDTSAKSDRGPDAADGDAADENASDDSESAAAPLAPLSPWEQASSAIAEVLPALAGPARRQVTTPAPRRSATEGGDVSEVGFLSPDSLAIASAETPPAAHSPSPTIQRSSAPAAEIAAPATERQPDASLVASDPTSASSPARRTTAAAETDRQQVAAITSDEMARLFSVQEVSSSRENLEASPATASADNGSVAPYIAAALARPLPRRIGDGQELPHELRFRSPEEKPQAAHHLGGNERTEKAVRMALDWLAAAQRPSGEWDAASFGAGKETRALGQDRSGVGADANAGVTGLALLAFLGAGHTHLEGDFRKVVQHGLEYLLRVQEADGNLAGTAELYAHMYCHGMATLALSEALAMTGDVRLKPAVEHAVGYTVAAQHVGGGWRYLPQDRGDMSQFGWQVLALRSAQLAGVEVPEKTRRAMLVFLGSVSSGRHQGLASYRQGEQISRTMTAEALLCRLLLPTSPSQETIDEAVAFILEELPGQGEPNEYYWYYATLALHQLQGESWRQWNEALQEEVLGRQQTQGRFSGSWNPDTVWGGYGGRVYSTAMAALCLEAYYRYSPRQAQAPVAVEPR